MHAISWSSESCDCNKDEYDRRNALGWWNPACGFWTDSHFADVPIEPSPTYGHSWPQRHSVHFQYDNNRVGRTGETAIWGWYVTQRVVWPPALAQSTTTVTLTALTVCVHFDGVIPPGRKCFLLMGPMGKYPTRDAKKDPGYRYGQNRLDQWSRSDATCCHTVGSGDSNRRWRLIAACVYSIYSICQIIIRIQRM